MRLELAAENYSSIFAASKVKISQVQKVIKYMGIQPWLRVELRLTTTNLI